MPRFQLVFRDARGERSETRDNNLYNEPHIDGKLIVDGDTYTIRGVDWVMHRDDRDGGIARFVCIRAAARPG